MCICVYGLHGGQAVAVVYAIYTSRANFSMSTPGPCVHAYIDFLLSFLSDVTATGIETTAFNVPAKGT